MSILNMMDIQQNRMILKINKIGQVAKNLCYKAYYENSLYAVKS